MMLRMVAAVALSATVLALAAARAVAQNPSTSALVKITPLGSHAGELCRNDRAMVFEDPTGVRILYDPGRTVDETDSRLGDVHVMLLSHAHTDHLGDTRPNRSAPGTCAAPAAGPANPDSNFVRIAAAKNAAVIAPGELADFLGRKLQNLRGAATPACAANGLDSIFDVPPATACTATLRPGGSRTARRAGGASDGVRIAVVPAVHSNGINAQFLDAPGVAAGLSGYGGSEGGFVVKFTTGLIVYLTGDTGMFGDMDTIVARFYRPSLVVINMSDTATLGPAEAAYVIRTLVRPRSVMPTHVNEEATASGAIRAGTRVDMFNGLVRTSTDVIVPLSEVTRTFDGSGRCVGCR